MKKAQSSFEMFVTVATFLAFSVPVILAVLAASQLRLEDLSLVHGATTVQLLSDDINEVYLQGNGARRSVLLDLPSATRNITVSDGMVVLYLKTSSGPYEISHPIIANASYFSESRSGLTNIVLTMEGGQVVLQ